MSDNDNDIPDLMASQRRTPQTEKIPSAFSGDRDCAQCRIEALFGGCKEHKGGGAAAAPRKLAMNMSTREWRERQRQQNGSASRNFPGASSASSDRPLRYFGDRSTSERRGTTPAPTPAVTPRKRAPLDKGEVLSDAFRDAFRETKK